MSPTVATIDALATARLTRLVTKDVLTKRPRAAIIRAAYRRAGRSEHSGDPDDWPVIDGDDTPKLAWLITCPWCASVYVAAGVVLVRHRAPRLWQPVAELLAASQVAGLVGNLDT